MPIPVDEEDTRKVQTAVAGGPGADRPVYLPMDAVEFDAFIGLHPTRDFYCGSLLGGCGKKLSARKYRDKKCHFAHVASGHCRRASTNEASADHLYIGQALAAWLKKLKYKSVQVHYKQKGQSLREFVDVSYARGHGGHLMRVQLARRSKSEWEQADAHLQGQWAGSEWLFGPDSLLANWQVDRQGYAVRIQCRPLGLTRVVEVGVQYPGAPIEWVPLSECRMTVHGILAPALELTSKGLVPRGQHVSPPTRHVVQTPPTVPQQARHSESCPPAISTPVATPSTAEPDRQPSRPAMPRPTDREISAAFHKALRETARSRGLVSMQSLAERAKVPLASLTPARWTELLRPFELQRKKGEPVLSALILGAGEDPAPFLGELLRQLNWTSVRDEQDLKEFCRRHRALAHSTYADHPVTVVRTVASEPVLKREFPKSSYEAPNPLPGPVSLERLQTSDDRRATERLVAVLDYLDRMGDELHIDQLQTFLRRITAFEEAMWLCPTPEVRRRITTWRSHSAELAARPTFREICAYADVVRLALSTAARIARPLTWMDLGARLDRRLPALHPDDKVSVLVEVDRPTCSDRPLLSSLVAAPGNRVHPLYAQVLDHLDRPVPPPHEAQVAWEQDVRRHRRSGEPQFTITARVAWSHV
ncbi:hypothetical protein ACFWWB_30805 [Streptomyces sp. NPDC058690]|uniref:hypothetical protein n=1 Tax=Streptomyces sp. NPDC058690 TaxID=3346600 RepID=UPI003651F7B9